MMCQNGGINGWLVKEVYYQGLLEVVGNVV
jgi:hypothetical protein